MSLGGIGWSLRDFELVKIRTRVAKSTLESEFARVLRMIST